MLRVGLLCTSQAPTTSPRVALASDPRAVYEKRLIIGRGSSREQARRSSPRPRSGALSRLVRSRSLREGRPMTSKGSHLAAPLGLTLAATLLAGPGTATEPSKEALIEDALSAAPPSIRETAKVTDEHGTVLRDGSGRYVCMPTAASLRQAGKEPMCVDEVWMAWADAW